MNRKKIALIGFLGLFLVALIIFVLQPKLAVRGMHFARRQVVAVIDRDEKVMEIPLIAQTKNLNCEATTAQMIMQYYKKDTTIDLLQMSLPLHENPHKGFRGNVDGPIWGFDDYGVYAEPIANVMTQFDVPTKAYKNITADFLKKKILAGKPAIVWVNVGNPHPETKWIEVDGEKVKLISGEHVVVVTGYSHGRWIVNDPWNTTGKDGKPVAKQFKVDNLDDLMWNDFDHMAVIIE